jgi:hypothetical protein
MKSRMTDMKREEKIVTKSKELRAEGRTQRAESWKPASSIQYPASSSFLNEIQQFTIINNSPSIPPVGGIREPLAGNSDLPVISYQLCF